MKKNQQSSQSAKPEHDWTKVLFEILIKILTLGFYHIEKHRNKYLSLPSLGRVCTQSGPSRADGERESRRAWGELSR